LYINATNNANINANNNASINTTNNAAIDIMKFICAILIVSIHTSPLLEINRLWSLGITIYIARIAVPFFFVTSGYFFAKKIMTTNGSSRVFPDYLLKLFKLYVGWSLVYFPLYIYYAGLFKSDTLKKSMIYL